MNKRKVGITIIFTFFVLLIGIILYKILLTPKDLSDSTTKTTDPTTVNVGLAKDTSIFIDIPIQGRLYSNEKVNLSANAAGKLLSTPLKIVPGLKVNKGDLLFQIAHQKEVQNLNAMRSSLLNRVILFMPDLKVDHPLHYQEWEQFLAIFDVEKNVPSLPKTTNEQEKYFVASKNIYQLYYQIKSAEIQLADYSIVAPFTGIITSVSVDPGAIVVPGQPMAALINHQKYELMATIPETQMSFLELGKQVIFQANKAGNEYNGRLVRIGAQIDPITQSVPVYFQVSGQHLKDGMYLLGALKGQRLDQLVAIPKNLIIDQQYIYTVVDSTIVKKEIILEFQDENLAYVKAFNEDTWMVLQAQEDLTTGQKVTPEFKPSLF